MSVTATYLQERVFVNESHIAVDIEKFNSGEKNVLFITGLSGAGKTTISSILQLSYKCDYVELDVCLRRYGVKLQKQQYYDCLRKVIYDSFKSKKRVIVEGTQLLWIYTFNMVDRDLLMSTPTIFLGTSWFKSTVAASGRNVEDPRLWPAIPPKPLENAYYVQKYKIYKRDRLAVAESVTVLETHKMLRKIEKIGRDDI